jgi:uncharacterized protein
MIMRRYRLPLSIGLVVLGVVLLAMWLERSMVYPAPPPMAGDWQPSWLDFESVEFESSDGTHLHGWYLEHPQARGCLLFCHGNGEHVAFLAQELDYLRDHLQLNVLAFDYRGYGKSQGKPFEAGVLADAEAAHQWLVHRADCEPESIVLYGRSLGGAVAVHLASRHGAAGVILDRTFSSLVDVAATHFPWLPVRWLMHNHYHSIDRIADYRGPLLQIHGRDDRIVPFALGQRLFEAAPSEDKELIAPDDLGHNDPWSRSIAQSFRQFVDRVVTP